MSFPTPAQDDSRQRLDRLSELARDVLRLCAARGASQAEVLLNEDRGLSVGVRLGEVETVERTRDRSLAVTVYFGRRKGNASTADLQPGSLQATVEQACAIARHTEPDPAHGLADAERMAGELREFDGWHPWPLEVEAAIALAVEAETAGREADPRVCNSEGANLSSSESLSVYANSHGFLGPERGSSHYLGLSLIAGRGEGMQRDYWYTSALAPEDLEAPAAVGRRAAERVVARLSPRPVKTGQYPVLFVPETARSLIGHLLAAASGGALYRQASFLLGALGRRILPPWFGLAERPHLMRGLRSSCFDAEGVATADADIVREGVLERYLLSSYSARKLGMQSTGHAGGVTNLVATANASGYAELLAGLDRGLVVTELMGQGANTVTGDYSRGAAGFWVENGAIVHPVDEVTIAGRLQDIFPAIEAVGADVDRRSHIGIGSVLVGRMTVAGQG
ncbi:metalloprotease PmbA [Arenimonas fontis]|uniref:Metalloprotease PmbA n=1 Tax=Arenimonas fontis TaxID=2608255 RepID=A0A5B2ZDS0_9GAMM|nr:metalloprotease PmbA [Arenimonas fontis]KAA2286266.1 metalloprotease PmbA [Arenimonas fontis]